AWLFLMFPDHFENISSFKHKRQIREAFELEHLHMPAGSIDEDLLSIRNSMSSKYGEGFHFYRSPVVEQWREKDRAPGKPAPKSGQADEPNPTERDRGEALYLDPPEAFGEWLELLRDRKQVMFQGPPGTGKTYIARQLAEALTADRGRVDIVQFHPSYAYE